MDEEKNQEIVGDKVDELTLEMTDDELIDLTKKWKKNWNEVGPNLEKIRKEMDDYYLGKEKVASSDEERPLIDNLIFEAIETFLPMATRKNPDPIVVCDETPAGKEFAEIIAKKLVDLSDQLRIKLRIKRVVKFWALYLLGVAKISWSAKEDEMSIEVLRADKLIMDANSFIDDDLKYTGEFLGQYKGDTIAELKVKFPDKEKLLDEISDSMEGTKLQYIEWWTDDSVFWTYKEDVLGKNKNPHWNYEYEESQVDDEGVEMEPAMVQPYNHFKYAQMPYIFLSIFNLNKHPYDETSLIQQALPMQDLINRRQHQINKNVDEMNGGWVVGGGVKSKDEATEIVNTLRDGGAAFMPDTTPREAVDKFTSPPLPNDVFNHLIDGRNELRNLFGVRGSTPQGTQNEKTVGGKVIIKEQDSSRIGGSTSEFIEQFADRLFNWMVQMMTVYYDEKRTSAVIGAEGELSEVTISKELFQAYNKEIRVSVKEGSLIPKDPMSEANEALTLAQANLLDPITMFDKLDYPDPQKKAKRLFLWQTAPQLMFPDLLKAVETEEDIKTTKEQIREQEDTDANKEESSTS